MREIKFRVWDKEKQIMLHAFPFDITFELQNEPYVAMQYTGLKDKNGKEIYEGDIVDNDGDLFKVVYMDARFMGESEDGLLDFPTKNWLVVGNLYENPNLLTKTNDREREAGVIKI